MSLNSFVRQDPVTLSPQAWRLSRRLQDFLSTRSGLPSTWMLERPPMAVAMHGKMFQSGYHSLRASP